MVKNRLLVFLILLGFAGSGCVVLQQIKPRVPAPYRTPEGVVFQFYAPSAQYVNLAGDFNRWCGTQDGPFNPNLGRMYDDGTNGDKKAGDGIWTIVLPLKPGTYQYKYVVNGSSWYLDPSNPETVQSGPYTNSLLRVE
jgi:1,4-alpha-glucan branching enzyme